MNDADITGRGATRGQDGPPWRVDAMRGMLTFGSVVAPLASLLAIMLRPPPHPLLDTVVLACAGLVMPVLRLAPGLSYSWRAGVTIASFLAAGVFVIARSGLAPGVSLLFAVTSIFAAMYFGRAAGYAMVGLGALSFIAVGWFATNGHLPVPQNAFDPHRFENWFRVGIVYALIASLLTSAVTFVIGRVEASARALRVAYERLGQLHLRLESTKEEERRFLAHELHDEFGQLLTALKLRIQLVARGAAPSSAPGGETDPLVVIDDLIARVRRMSGDLRPPLLDEVGLLPAIRAYLEAQSAVSGVAMTLEADELQAQDGALRLGPELDITCFRIVQEAVTNVLRHAGARDLRVRIELHADRVALRIHDDGRGFDVGVRLEGAAADGHLGVVGMRERVRAHGGSFRMHSRPGAGTAIEVELPLRARAFGAAATGAVAS